MSTSQISNSKVAWGQVVWFAFGLFWSIYSLNDYLTAGPDVQRQIHVLPIAAGAVIVLAASWTLIGSVLHRDENASASASGVPEVQSRPGEVALLMGIFLVAWLLMPVLGLVLTSLVLFVALALFYRDMTPWAVVANLALLFVIIAYGAGTFLNMPLLQSSVFNLPF